MRADVVLLLGALLIVGVVALVAAALSDAETVRIIIVEGTVTP